MAVQGLLDAAPVSVRIVHRACGRFELVASLSMPGVERSAVTVTRTKNTVKVAGPVRGTALWLEQELDLPARQDRRWGDPVVLATARDAPVMVRIPLAIGKTGRWGKTG